MVLEAIARGWVMASPHSLPSVIAHFVYVCWGDRDLWQNSEHYLDNGVEASSDLHGTLVTRGATFRCPVAQGRAAGFAIIKLATCGTESRCGPMCSSLAKPPKSVSVLSRGEPVPRWVWRLWGISPPSTPSGSTRGIRMVWNQRVIVGLR